MIGFSSKIMIYGSPKVIKAFNAFRESAESGGVEILKKAGELILAMRDDLGESNEGLDSLDVVSLLIKGGKTAMQKEINKSV